MRYVECPDIFEGNDRSLFLAGGISGCSNWQDNFVNMLNDISLILINPRRKNYDFNNPDLINEQIIWEFQHLLKASAVSFYFPSETFCPITLYELGKVSASDKPLFIGIHPDYQRKIDIEIQTSLIRSDVKIVYSLNDLASQIKEYDRSTFLLQESY